MINDELVQYVANLAKLGISEDEIKKFSNQIEDVFKYFDDVKALDLGEIEPTSQVTGLENVTRDDEVHLIYSVEKLMKQAPEVEVGQIKVPGVMKGKK